MIFKRLLSLYLIALFLMTAAPLGGLNTTLTHTFVIHLRLDYLLHALMFTPLVLLWHLSFPHHPLRLIIPAGLTLAIGLEGIQYLLPYRAWNINDAIGNGIGIFMGVGLMRMRQNRPLMKELPTPEIRFPRH